MPAQLVALTDGPSILLDKPILLLGRHPECDIQLNSRKVSRRHCCIAQVNNYLVVRDLGSTNGVRINGVRVLEGKIKTGDELTVGNFRYQLTWDDKPVSAAMPNAVPVGKMAKPLHAKPGTAPIDPKHLGPMSRKPSTESDDELLESCDEPVPIGKAGRKPATPASGDSPPIFPDNVDLRDSKLEI